MIVGIPKEIKPDEYRVAIPPAAAGQLVTDGHTVLVERRAGEGSGFADEEYGSAGAELVGRPGEIFARCDLIVKVKEPQPAEIEMFTGGQVVFTFFHFASSRELTAGCLQAGITAVAYETLADPDGRLPLLAPMSEIAGKLAAQEGAKYLERPMGGRGVLLSGATGVEPASVLVLGGGVAGSNAARVAAGMGANVVILDVDAERLAELAKTMPPNVTPAMSSQETVRRHAAGADLVVGAVLVPGARAPKLITRRDLKSMKQGAVIVDIAIDQGGCVETSRPTTHHEPTYVVDGVVHYCVTNMPAAVSRTSTKALANATLPYIRELARLGVDGFAAVDAGHAAAINMHDGKITNAAVSEALGDPSHD